MEKQLGNIAKHSRKLQDFQMFPNLPMGLCLWAFASFGLLPRVKNNILLTRCARS
jgi:hypothetical protein